MTRQSFGASQCILDFKCFFSSVICSESRSGKSAIGNPSSTHVLRRFSRMTSDSLSRWVVTASLDERPVPAPASGFKPLLFESGLRLRATDDRGFALELLLRGCDLAVLDFGDV